MPDADGLRLVRGPLFKSALLLNAPLFLMLSAPVEPVSTSTVSLFLANMFLYLCFAYAVNDWADRDADRAAQKHRTLATLPAPVVLVIIVALALAALVVGFFLAPSWRYRGGLVSGLLLGVAYSAPPLRLKNRGAWGVAMAPVLGKVIPVALAGALLGRFDWSVAVIACAEWTKNAIDILFHQIVDYDNDRMSNLATYPVRHGPERSRRLLRRLALVGVVAALAMGATIAWFVHEYRYVLVAAVLLAPPAVLLSRRIFGGPRSTALTDGLPPLYLWFGGIVFMLSPLWLSLVAASRDPRWIPLATVMAVVAVGQALFYLRYRYH